MSIVSPGDEFFAGDVQERKIHSATTREVPSDLKGLWRRSLIGPEVIDKCHVALPEAPVSWPELEESSISDWVADNIP